MELEYISAALNCPEMFDYSIFVFILFSNLHIVTIYIHFESIYCILIVSLFDWQSIAKAGQPIAKHFSKWRMEKQFCDCYWPPSLNLAAIVSQV